MARRYINWKLAAVVLLGFAVLAVTAIGLRRWRRSNRAEQGLVLGTKAYEQQRWDEAARQLSRYVSIIQDDVPVLMKYAEAQLKRRPVKRKYIQQAIAAYRTILRVQKDNAKAALQLAGLYITLGMPGEAELIASRFLDNADDPRIRLVLGSAQIAQRKFAEGVKTLTDLIKDHPDQIAAYETLARLAAQRPDDVPRSAEDWLNQAVQNNPSTPLAYIARANYYIQTHQEDKALADLREAEKLDLSDPQVRVRLAEVLLSAGQVDRAEQQLEQLKKTDPTVLALWQTWARLALRSGSTTKMAKVAEQALESLGAQKWDFLPRATELFIRSGKLDQARQCIAQLRQKDIEQANVAFLEGLLANAEGKLPEAIRCWQRSIELGNRSAGLRLALAAALRQAGDKHSALGQLQRVVEENPNLVNGRLTLAKLLVEMKQWSEAAEQARRAYQLAPENRDAAILYLQTTMETAASNNADPATWQRVESEIAKLEKVHGPSVDFELLKFDTALRQSKFDQAQKYLEQIKQKYPNEPRLAIAQAQLLATQDKLDQAIEVLHTAIAERPEATDGVQYLASLLAAQNRNSQCEKVLLDALEKTNQPTARQELGLTLAQYYSYWGEHEKAYSLLQRLATELPNSIPIKRQLLQNPQLSKDLASAQKLVDEIKQLEGPDGRQWRYEQARIWFLSSNFKANYARIVQMLKENLVANPDDQESRMLLAATYQRAGNIQAALVTYREALDRSPNDPRIIAAAVEAFYNAGQYEQAMQLLKRLPRSQQQNPVFQKLQLRGYLESGQLQQASDILQSLVGTDPNNVSAQVALALLHISQRNFAEARRILEKLRAEEPNSLAVTVAHVELSIQENHFDEAIALCDEIVKSLHNVAAYVFRGKTYAAIGNTEKALADFETAIKRDPNNVQPLVARSELYRSQGQLHKAIDDIRRALSIDPNNVAIQKRAITLLLSSQAPKHLREALSLLDKALQANPKDSELLIAKSQLLLAEATAPSLKQASQILENLTESNPRLRDAWVLQGELALARNEPGKAIDIALRGLVHLPQDKELLKLKAKAEKFRSPIIATSTLRQLYELDPNDAETALELANTYIAAEQPQRAVGILKKVLDRVTGPAQRKCKIALALALHLAGQKQQSQQYLNELLQESPDDPILLAAQIRLLTRDKKWTEIKQKTLQWYQEHPQDTSTPVNIARELAALGSKESTETAEQILRAVLETTPQNPEALRALAILLQATNRPNQAVPFYRKLLSVQPNDVVAMNNLAWILCENQQRYKEALKLTEKAIQQAPTYVDLIDTRGVAYYRLGQYDKAVEQFKRCLELYPAGSPALAGCHFHLGRTLAALQKTDEAVKHLQIALQLAAASPVFSDTDKAEAQQLLRKLARGG